MIPQEKIDSRTQHRVPAYRIGFDDGVRFAESELHKPASKSATEYLESKGRIIEGINGKTGEYVITPEQLDEYAEQFKPKPTTSAESKQNLFDYFAQQHEINLMSTDFWEIENYVKPDADQKAMDYFKWCILNKVGYFESIDKFMYDNVTLTESELFAKFEEERNRNNGGQHEM